ncbi:unnamed protein product [Rotaria sp. Silwood1]|nr:unnamed protein product [Rotaria sp. Silwood1]
MLFRKQIETYSLECIEKKNERVLSIIKLIKLDEWSSYNGYYVGEIEDDESVLKPTNVLKCSHGSDVMDKTGDIPAVDCSNKDVKTFLLSPHYYHLQEKVANAAIESTYLFLKKLGFNRKKI